MRLGQEIDKKIVVESGVNPGDVVVTDGQMRLIPGAPVRIVPAVNQPPETEKGAI